MNTRGLKRYLAIMLMILLTGCDHPVGGLDETELIEFTYTKGGLKLIRDIDYVESDDFLSEKSDYHFQLTKNDESYKLIMDFLNLHDTSLNLFNSVDILPRHVLLARIQLIKESGQIISLAIGKNWLVYYGTDFFKESAPTVFPVEEKEIIRFLKVLAKKMKKSGPQKNLKTNTSVLLGQSGNALFLSG